MTKKYLFTSVFVVLTLISFYPAQLAAQGTENSELRLSFAGTYLSRFVAYGLDLAGESPALRGSATISHGSGFYADAYYTFPTDNTVENAQQAMFDVGYEAEFGEIFSFYAEYASYIYSSDTVNVLAQYSGSISLNAGIDLSVVDLGFSYDRFLGDNAASYFSLDVSAFYETGPVYIMPMAQLVFMSQTIEDRYLGSGKGKKDKNEPQVTTTVTGLSTSSLTAVVVYPAAPGLTISFVPSLIFYHKSELSVESSRFLWNAGLRYSFDL